MANVIHNDPGRYLQEMWDDFVDITDRAPAGQRRIWAPAVDVRKTDKEYLVEADLPGMTEDDIDLRVESDRLILESSKEEEEQVEEEGYLRKERFSRTFRRSFRLPTDVNEERIKAVFQKGVLTVTLPRTKKETESAGRQIEIKSK
ncbi:MAG: Hsp20/alpha crystallin family protein [Spirochaetota bacterium]